MAKESSFDISAKVNMQELKNAIDQSQRELSTRYDFKGVFAEINLLEKEKIIELKSTSDAKVDVLKDMLISKMIKRGLSPNNLKEEKREGMSGSNLRLVLKIVDTIDKKEAKAINAFIKSLKLKLSSTIIGDEIRVSSKSKDDLQKLMKALKEETWDAPLVFDNYR